MPLKTTSQQIHDCSFLVLSLIKKPADTTQTLSNNIIVIFPRRGYGCSSRADPNNVGRLLRRWLLDRHTHWRPQGSSPTSRFSRRAVRTGCKFETPSAFHPLAQRNAFHHHGVRQQSRSFT